MPVIRYDTDADRQIEQRDQENREYPGLHSMDPFLGAGSEFERTRCRTAAHAGQAPEAFLGLHHLFFLNIDQRRAVLRAGAAVDALLFVPPDLERAETAEQAK